MKTELHRPHPAFLRQGPVGERATGRVAAPGHDSSGRPPNDESPVLRSSEMLNTLSAIADRCLWT